MLAAGRWFLFAALAAAAPISAAATPIVNTGTPQDAFGPRVYLWPGVAGQFTVANAETINSVETYLGGGQVQDVTLTLYADRTGPLCATGSVLHQATFTSVIGNGSRQGVSGLGWALAPGTFWITVEETCRRSHYSASVSQHLGTRAAKVENLVKSPLRFLQSPSHPSQLQQSGFQPT